jgi:hypothetical protein
MKKLIILVCLISLFIIGCNRKENEGFKFRVIKVSCNKDICEYKIQGGGKSPSTEIIFYDKQGLFMAGDVIKFVKDEPAKIIVPQTGDVNNTNINSNIQNNSSAIGITFPTTIGSNNPPEEKPKEAQNTMIGK